MKPWANPHPPPPPLFRKSISLLSQSKEIFVSSKAMPGSHPSRQNACPKLNLHRPYVVLNKHPSFNRQIFNFCDSQNEKQNFSTFLDLIPTDTGDFRGAHNLLPLIWRETRWTTEHSGSSMFKYNMDQRNAAYILKVKQDSWFFTPTLWCHMGIPPEGWVRTLGRGLGKPSHE